MKILAAFVMSFVITFGITYPWECARFDDARAQTYCDQAGGEIERFKSNTVVGCIKWSDDRDPVDGCQICTRGPGRILFWWEKDQHRVQFNW
jgi:hypothetical protein